MLSFVGSVSSRLATRRLTNVSLSASIGHSFPASPSSLVNVSVNVGGRGLSTIVSSLNNLAATLPHKDAVRYHKQSNMKWTFGELKKYSDALANGMLELGIAPKSTVLTWLPSDTAEQHVLQLACARAGIILATLPSTCTDASVLEKVLEDSGACAVFVQGDTRIPFEVRDEDGNVVVDDANMPALDYDDVYLKAVREAVPALDRVEYFNGKRDEETGEIVDDKKHISTNFVDQSLTYSTAKFPNFHFPIQTGFDKVDGFYNYKHLMAFNSSSLVMYP